MNHSNAWASCSGGPATSIRSVNCLQVSASVAITRMVLFEGQESTNNHRLDVLPVLEVEIAAPGTIETTVAWTHATE